MFILIVGGRYGSEISAGSKKPREFFDRYESITKKEYGSAVDKDIPVYILIEKGVYGEYQTFIRNKNLKDINYAHVDSVNVFLLVEDILAKPRNNPVHTFEKFEDIESWLREQWAGLFRELLRRQSHQQELAGLSQQVLQLKETNDTLKKYLEAVMRGIGKQETSRLIESEEKRLSDIRQFELIRRNPWVEYVTGRAIGLDLDSVVVALREASGFEDFADRVRGKAVRPDIATGIVNTLRTASAARRDMNDARRVLNLPPFETPDDWPFMPGFEDDRADDRVPSVKIKTPPDTGNVATGPASGQASVPKKASRRKAPPRDVPDELQP
jgi:hypothetical protein